MYKKLFRIIQIEKIRELINAFINHRKQCAGNFGIFEFPIKFSDGSIVSTCTINTCSFRRFTIPYSDTITIECSGKENGFYFVFLFFDKRTFIESFEKGI